MKKLISILLILASINSYAAYHRGDNVVLKVKDGCPACEEAEALLNSSGVPHKVEKATSGYFVPQFYVNGKFLGDGVGPVEIYLHE